MSRGFCNIFPNFSKIIHTVFQTNSNHTIYSCKSPKPLQKNRSAKSSGAKIYRVPKMRKNRRISCSNKT